MTFAVVLLAAGGSTRMGSPKALLPYRDRTLIEHAVDAALASGPTEVVVVLGADADPIRARLEGRDVRFVLNEGWAEGMGSSIRAGIATLSEDVDGVVVALGDQPRITSEHLHALADRMSEAPIVASSYDGVLGAPCAFARVEFGRLRELRGDAGARALVRSGDESVTAIAFEEAHADVDTPEAYRDLLATETGPAS